MSDSNIARTYDPDKNPDGAFLPGVPLRDITAAEWDTYPEWLQRSIDACGFYAGGADADTAVSSQETPGTTEDSRSEG